MMSAASNMAAPTIPGFLKETAVWGSPVQLRKSLFRHRLGRAKALYNRNLVGHFGCVNAIEFSNNGGQFLASGGDDRRVLFWNVQEALSVDRKFEVMIGEHHSNIFSLAFDGQNSRIYSGGNDDQVLVHDIQRKETVDVFLHEDAVYSLAVDPRDSHIFISACADGRVLLWDTRVPSHQEPFVIANSQTAFYAVVYHPVEHEFLATANSKEGVALWDVRAPRSSLVRYGSTYTQQNAMSVRFNQLGTRLVALRRRLPPVVYNVHSSAAAVQFNHSGYYNSCTMKSCTFAGDKDQYVLSGSDDFNLYMWEVPEPCEDVMWVDEAKLVLQGHRSIVNQVRFNAHTHNIVSSGVEKIIKLWSPFTFPNTKSDEDCPRQMFSHQQYIDLVINSGSALSHDYTDQSMEEDPRMIAFFDSLVQREINRSFSDSDDSDMSPESLYVHFAGEGSDEDNSRGTDSGSSLSVPPDSLIRRLVESNEGTSPTAQLRTLWSLAAAGRVSSSANSTAVGADNESNSDTPSGQETPSAPQKCAAKTRHLDGQPRRGASDHPESRRPAAGGGGDARARSLSGSESASSKRKRCRQQHQRAGSSPTTNTTTTTTSPDSSSSDEDANFEELRARSRLLRRFLMRKKRRPGTETDDSQQGPGSDGPANANGSDDRVINLKQRMAISRALQGKIARPEAGLTRPGATEEDLARITEHLKQRSMAAHQRLAISRMRRRLQQESRQGLEDLPDGDVQPAQETSGLGRLLPSTTQEPNHTSSSNDPLLSGQHRSSCNDRSPRTGAQPLPNSDSHPAGQSAVCPPPPPLSSAPSFCVNYGDDQPPNNHPLMLQNSGDYSGVLPGCSSGGEPGGSHHSLASHAGPVGLEPPGNGHTSQHRNEFHKFKNQTARATRRYRPRKEKKVPDNSDTE